MARAGESNETRRRAAHAVTDRPFGVQRPAIVPIPLVAPSSRVRATARGDRPHEHRRLGPHAWPRRDGPLARHALHLRLDALARLPRAAPLAPAGHEATAICSLARRTRSLGALPRRRPPAASPSTSCSASARRSSRSACTSGTAPAARSPRPSSTSGSRCTPSTSSRARGRAATSSGSRSATRRCSGSSTSRAAPRSGSSIVGTALVSGARRRRAGRRGPLRRATRRAHGRLEPARARRGPRPAARRRDRESLRRHARDPRHRPLQALQRHARPPRRRRHPHRARGHWSYELRPSDSLARFGGDEFTILFPAQHARRSRSACSSVCVDAAPDPVTSRPASPPGSRASRRTRSRAAPTCASTAPGIRAATASSRASVPRRCLRLAHADLVSAAVTTARNTAELLRDRGAGASRSRGVRPRREARHLRVARPRRRRLRGDAASTSACARATSSA